MANLVNTTSCDPPMPFESTRQLLVVVYSIVFAVGLPSNCITAILTVTQIRRKNIPAIYLFALSFCELLYLSTIPLWIIYVQNDHHWTMPPLLCKVTGYIFFCNVYISILLLCCISVDRYVAVVYALECRGKRCQRTATAVTVALFVVVGAIHSPVFYLGSITPEKNTTTCFETLPLNRTLAVMNGARFLTGFLIPFAILIFMNYKIFQSIKFSCSLTPHQKAKVKYLVIAIITIFVVCFAPYHSVLLIRSVYFFLHRDTCAFERHIYSTSVIFLCFSTANSVADPFIYVLASENTRREISRFLGACGIQLSNDSQRDSTRPDNSKRPPKASHEGS